jgi:hypothetical protein
MKFTKEEKLDYTAPYRQSDSVIRAQQAVQAQQNLKPDQYQSRWQDQLDAMMGQIQDRPAFQYDVNADALWNQYKDQYLNQGRQAMMDTMGQAAAMTGGYGNSYAQTVGQQAYQGYLQGLNAKIPELYQLALGKYQMEGDNLLNQYGMMADVEGQEYGRYMDALNQYYAELDRLQGIYDSERNYDYGMWADNRDFSYAQYRDQVADQQWQAQWDENIRRYNFENGLGEYASSGGGGDEDNGYSSSYTGATAEDKAIAKQFVNNMLNNSTGSRTDPERVIAGTIALTDAQKNEAQKYLKDELGSGRMT